MAPRDWPENARLGEDHLVKCTQCSRLAEFLAGQRDAHPDWWNRPVPGFGDREARLLIIGLAPGLSGANRTGRPFTGDAAGEWLYGALHEHGFSNRPESATRDDDLLLRDCYIANAVKCVPPGNRPTGEEANTCGAHLAHELEWLANVRVVLALGKVAHDAYLRVRRSAGIDLRMKDFPFGHGSLHELPQRPHHLLDSYHTSRQNTNTGVLTWKMWSDIFVRAKGLIDGP